MKDTTLNSIYWPCAACLVSYARQNVLVAKEAQQSKEMPGIWNSMLPSSGKPPRVGRPQIYSSLILSQINTNENISGVKPVRVTVTHATEHLS